jgi:plasmid stabilization system protein ParE
VSSPPPPVSVVFHRLAAEEYRRARRWYARRSAAAAQRLQEAVDRVVQAIAASPAQGAPFRGRYRWMRTRRFPYVIYYDVITPTHVMVLAVAQASRRPGYWIRRSP